MRAMIDPPPRLVRVCVRVQPLDALGRTAGAPYWIEGDARLHPDHDRFAPSVEVKWVAHDGGVFYRVSTEEPPCTR